MTTVKEILDIKGLGVLSIGPNASARDAALLMTRHQIGSLIVMDDGDVLGIITERDLLRQVLAEGRDAVQTSVRDVMTSEILCCQPHTSIAEARLVMKERRIRHLPVSGADGQIMGLISIGDLNAQAAQSQEQTIHILEAYINGRT
jgi:CBS domain-containing protein